MSLLLCPHPDREEKRRSDQKSLPIGKAVGADQYDSANQVNQKLKSHLPRLRAIGLLARARLALLQPRHVLEAYLALPCRAKPALVEPMATLVSDDPLAETLIAEARCRLV